MYLDHQWVTYNLKNPWQKVLIESFNLLLSLSQFFWNNYSAHIFFFIVLHINLHISCTTFSLQYKYLGIFSYVYYIFGVILLKVGTTMCMSVNMRWNGRGWPGKVPRSPVASPETAKEQGNWN
jgi:hypothetical protein